MALTDKIKKLKDIISDYETKELLTFLAGILLQIPQREENPFIKGLMSPMRQLFFLALLNLNRNSEKNKKGFSEEEWDEIASLLHGIEIEYFFLLGFPKNGKETEEERNKIMVTMPTFMNYYFNGPLAYQEQEIERIEKVFKDFEPQINNFFKVSLSDFITFYDLVNESAQDNLNSAMKFVNKDAWQKFTSACLKKGLSDPRQWLNEAPDEIHAFAQFMHNPGSLLVLDLEKLNYSNISRDKFELIVNLFSCEARPTDEINYYTEDNELLKKPFLKISDTKYLSFFSKQYLNSCYNLIFNKCLELNKDKALRSRDVYVEQKVGRILKKFFKKEGYFYSNYSIDNGKSEQDLMILYKGKVLIIEMKASNYRAPMRDANKAFDKLKSDFKKNVQYGYEQTSRVVKAFAENDKLSIIDSKNNLLYEVSTSRFKTYSMVVTLERFGHIQTNLEDMLEIYENEDYPWCVSMDDLEAFLLTLAKRQDRIQRFFSFLEYRQNYHGHLICSDELELCGSFLIDEKKFKQQSLQDETIVTLSDLTEPIESSYKDGMGFEKERQWENKKDKHSHFLYHDSKKKG
jgi:hypothetical protein